MMWSSSTPAGGCSTRLHPIHESPTRCFQNVVYPRGLSSYSSQTTWYNFSASPEVTSGSAKSAANRQQNQLLMLAKFIHHTGLYGSTSGGCISLHVHQFDLLESSFLSHSAASSNSIATRASPVSADACPINVNFLTHCAGTC